MEEEEEIVRTADSGFEGVNVEENERKKQV